MINHAMFGLKLTKFSYYIVNTLIKRLNTSKLAIVYISNLTNLIYLNVSLMTEIIFTTPPNLI